MTTSGTSQAVYSGRTAFQLRLYVWRDSVSGNYSRYSWWLRAYNLNNSSSTFALDAMPWSVWIEHQQWNGNTNLDFRSGQAYIQLGSGQTEYYAHDAEGYRQIDFEAIHNASTSVFGIADTPLTSFQADRIPKPPDTPPLPVLGTKTSTSLNYTIALPADNGGSPVTTFYMELAIDSAFAGVMVGRYGTQASQTFTGLNPADDYWMRYRADNAIGSSAMTSPGVKGTTLATTPGQPTAWSISDVTPNSVKHTWSPPVSNGGAAITHYRLQRATNSAFTSGLVEYTPSSSPYTITGLSPGVNYYFRLAAVNSAGTGTWTATADVTTVSGVYYSNGTSWQAAGLFVSVGGVWVPATPHVSQGGVWVDGI